MLFAGVSSQAYVHGSAVLTLATVVEESGAMSDLEDREGEVCA